MRTPSWLFLFVLFALPTIAEARLPEAKERSLLYWRYLCRGEKQEEVVRDNVRELRCFGTTQGNWTVRAPASTGLVKEVIQDE